MSLTHTITVSFLKDAINGTTFDFSSSTSDVYKLALFTVTAALDYTSTAYSATNEVSGTGYTAAGDTLTIGTNPTIDGITVYITFSDLTFSSLTVTGIRYGLIYKADGGSNPSVAVIDFGASFSPSSADFVVDMPTKLIKLIVGT